VYLLDQYIVERRAWWVYMQTVAVQTGASQLTVEVFSTDFRTCLNTDISIRGVCTTRVGYQHWSGCKGWCKMQLSRRICIDHFVVQ